MHFPGKQKIAFLSNFEYELNVFKKYIDSTFVLCIIVGFNTYPFSSSIN